MLVKTQGISNSTENKESGLIKSNSRASQNEAIVSLTHSILVINFSPYGHVEAGLHQHFTISVTKQQQQKTTISTAQQNQRDQK